MSDSLLEMLPGEVAERLESGKDIAIIPIGSVEQHGPHELLGCDTYYTLAKCVCIARHCGGTILPLVPFTWVGGTFYFSGGVNVRQKVIMDYLRAVIRAAWRAGFRRILIVNSHGGSFYAMRSLPQEMLVEDGIPVMSVYGDAGAPGAKERRGGGLGGALRLLGREDLVADLERYTKAAVKEFGAAPEPAVSVKPYMQARGLGVVGGDYLDEVRHVSPSMEFDIDASVERIEEIGRHVAGLLDDWGKLVAELAG